MPDPTLEEECEALRRELEGKAIGRCARDWCPAPGDPFADVHVSASASGYHAFEFKWEPPLAPSPERLAEIKAEREAEKAKAWDEGLHHGLSVCEGLNEPPGHNPYSAKATAGESK